MKKATPFKNPKLERLVPIQPVQTPSTSKLESYRKPGSKHCVTKRCKASSVPTFSSRREGRKMRNASRSHKHHFPKAQLEAYETPRKLIMSLKTLPSSREANSIIVGESRDLNNSPKPVTFPYCTDLEYVSPSRYIVCILPRSHNECAKSRPISYRCRR